eukprot:Pgem_evm1s17646
MKCYKRNISSLDLENENYRTSVKLGLHVETMCKVCIKLYRDELLHIATDEAKHLRERKLTKDDIINIIDDN